MVQSFLLPEFLQQLPSNLQMGWLEVYRDVNADYGEALALVSANKWLKRELDQMSIEEPEDMNLEEDAPESEKEVVSEPVEEDKPSIIKLTFEIDMSKGELVKRDVDGNDYVDLVLQDIYGDKDGQTWSPQLLSKWADQINNGEVELFGDFDHSYFDELTAKHSDPSVVAQLLKEEKGSKSIAKGVKAVFEKGRLWLKAMIDKRYKRVINQSKGVSIEALTDYSAQHKSGDLLGFTFMTNKPQANARAVVV